MTAQLDLFTSHPHSCRRCDGLGTVMFGNKSGLCYRCEGKGHVTPADVNRNAKYWAKRRCKEQAASAIAQAMAIIAGAE